MPGPGPRQYVVRRPSGDPDAVRRLATAYDDLATAVAAQTEVAAHVLAALAWDGLGAHAVTAPEALLQQDAARVARALRESAVDLRAYAHRLQHAHEHHGWSLGRLVALGALVTAGAAAVVVTVGATAPAEAALATAIIEGAEAATAAADAASAAAAGSLATWQSLLGAIRPLAPFVVPHLVSAAGSVGFDAISELLTVHRVDVHSLEVAAAVGFAGSDSGAAAESSATGMSDVAKRVMEGGVWAAIGTIGEYADEGPDLADTVAFGLTGVVARDVRRLVDESITSDQRSHRPAAQP